MSKITFHASERVLEDFYEALARDVGQVTRRVHIPRSDVFYVREKIFQDTGLRYTLDRVERAMYLEGMLKERDVLDPDREREFG